MIASKVNRDSSWFLLSNVAEIRRGITKVTSQKSRRSSGAISRIIVQEEDFESRRDEAYLKLLHQFIDVPNYSHRMKGDRERWSL